MGPSDPSDFTMFPTGINDNPLEFNINKNKPSASRLLEDKDDSSQSPPEKRERRKSERRDRERRDPEKTRDDSDSNLSNPQEVIPLQNGPTSLTPNMWGGMMGRFII